MPPHRKHGLIAIVGDLFGSRQVSDRQRFVIEFQDVLERINVEYATQIFAPVKLVRGIDEVSAVMNRHDYAFEICARINEAIHPYKFRWGIGSGVIDVNERTRDAAQLDGPAFHNAANAINRARDKDLVYAFELPHADPSVVAFMESSAALYSEIVEHWTPSAAKIALAMRSSENQTQIAEQLGISRQRVSQNVKRNSIRELHRFEHTISWILNDLYADQQ